MKKLILSMLFLLFSSSSLAVADENTLVLSASDEGGFIDLGMMAPEQTAHAFIEYQGSDLEAPIIQIEIANLPRANRRSTTPLLLSGAGYIGSHHWGYTDTEDGSLVFSVQPRPNDKLELSFETDDYPSSGNITISARLLERNGQISLSSIGDSKTVTIGKVDNVLGGGISILRDRTSQNSVYNFEFKNLAQDSYLSNCTAHLSWVTQFYKNGTKCFRNQIVNGELSFSLANPVGEKVDFRSFLADQSATIWDDSDGVVVEVTRLDQLTSEYLESGNVYVNNIGSVGDMEIAFSHFINTPNAVNIQMEFSGLTSSEALAIKAEVQGDIGIIQNFTDDDVMSGRIKTSFGSTKAESVSVSVTGNISQGHGEHVKTLISVDEYCTSLIELNQNYNHRYNSDCESSQYSGRYASFFMFFVPSPAVFNIGLWSNVHSDLDNEVFLYKGYRRENVLLASDDDSSNRTQLGAQITQIHLDAGWYTVESTTDDGQKNGRSIIRVAKFEQ